MHAFVVNAQPMFETSDPIVPAMHVVLPLLYEKMVVSPPSSKA